MSNRFGNPFAAQHEHPAKTRIMKHSHTEAHDEDDRYERLSLDNEHPDVILKINCRGFICRRSNPYGHWTIDEAVDGQPLPADFSGRFTDKRSLFAVIDYHLSKQKPE